MNRFKLLILVLILAILTILFVQNQEPLSLKFFCADVAQSCLYQTSKLPLAAWISIFVIAGIFTSLLGQLFSNLGRSARKERHYPQATNFDYEGTATASTSQSSARNTHYSNSRNTSVSPRASGELNKQMSTSDTKSNPNTVIQSDWENSSDDDWNGEKPVAETIQDTPKNFPSQAEKTYEIRREPTSIQRSGSTYAYKYREASDNAKEKEEENQVYDANYRTINPPYKPLDTQETKRDEDDEDWV
jgi:hypothetical protein